MSDTPMSEERLVECEESCKTPGWVDAEAVADLTCEVRRLEKEAAELHTNAAAMRKLLCLCHADLKEEYDRGDGDVKEYCGKMLQAIDAALDGSAGREALEWMKEAFVLLGRWTPALLPKLKPPPFLAPAADGVK